MDNFGFLFAANAFVWGGIIYFIYTLKQRNRELEKDVELLKEAMTDTEFKFNLDPLSSNIDGLSRGHFGIILARPELGKTTFACHLANLSFHYSFLLLIFLYEFTANGHKSVAISKHALATF